MTQIPVSDEGVVAASPPVVVAAGVQVAIQYPAQAPQSLSWVVVNNSSPFTCVVSQGQVLGQLAAFTADAFPVRSGQPIGVLAFAGAGVVSPGTDSTVYATWYQSNPGGSYPAALGSGSAPIQSQSTIVPITGLIPLGAGANTIYGPFSTAGFGALTLVLQELLGVNPVLIFVRYRDATGAYLCARNMTVTSNGQVAVTIPHAGAQVEIEVRNDTAGLAAYQLQVSQQTLPTTQWLIGSTGSGPIATLIPSLLTVVGAGLTVVVGAAVFTYAGPATLFVNTSLATFALTLEGQESTGAWTVLESFTQGSWANGGDQRAVLLPPCPIRVRFNNTTGVASNIRAGVYSDDWRTAA